MAEPFIGEIRAFACSFAPSGWAVCDGQILPIQQHTALFAVIGNCFGGNAPISFALPNLQGRAPLAAGTGEGLTPRKLGEVVGQAEVALDQSHFPPHTHAFNVNAAENADTAEAVNGVLAKGGFMIKAKFSAINTYAPATRFGQTPMAADAIREFGDLAPSFPHDNMQPYLPLLLCIALTGVFPPQSRHQLSQAIVRGLPQ